MRASIAIVLLCVALTLAGCTVPDKSQGVYTSAQVQAAIRESGLQAQYAGGLPISTEWKGKITDGDLMIVTRGSNTIAIAIAILADDSAKQAYDQDYKKRSPGVLIYSRGNANIYIASPQQGKEIAKADADAIGSALQRLK
jgi:hypothetical protein